jgi:hypothetical protein
MPDAARFSKDRSSTRPRRVRRLGPPERLEHRNLLSATIYTVDALTDTGAGSGTTGDLEYAIDQADANTNPDGSLIQFDPTVFATPRTITLSSTLELSESAGPVVIAGPGANLLAISGNNDVGVFSIASGVTATIDGLTIAHGWAFTGGGIDNQGTLTVTDVTLANDSASLGGGIFNNQGTLELTGATLADDSAALGGGILNNGGPVTLDDAAFAGDLASQMGGGIYNGGDLTITNSTLAGNSAADGGAINMQRGSLTIVDSTVAGNSARDGGGINMLFGPLTAVNDTIAYNSASSGGGGGGLYIQGGIATLDNTIVALNTRASFAGATADDISQSGGLVSSASADNLIGTGGSGGLIDFNGNQVGVATPGLGPLGYYGGPTQTIALLPDSPAIGGGNSALAIDPTTGQPLEYDQRGTGFDLNLDGTVDVGAFAYLPAASDMVSVEWGTSGSAQLQTAADGLQLLPAGRTTDLPWSGIQRFEITMTQPLTAADVTVNSATGVNYGPVMISGSGPNYTITLAQPIDAADRVTITIVDPGVSIFNRQIDVLPGDVNDDGVVDSQDVSDFREAWVGPDRQYSIFDDIIGDGQLNVQDYELIREAVGTQLPAMGASDTKVGASPRAGSGSDAVPMQAEAASQPAASGQSVSQAASTAPPAGLPLVVQGRGWSLGTTSKNAAIGGARFADG